MSTPPSATAPNDQAPFTPDAGDRRSTVTGVLGYLERLLLKCLPSSPRQGWSALTLGVLGAFGVSLQLWEFLHSGEQRYDDLVAGYIIWTDRFKDGDYLSIFAFIGLTALISSAALALLKWLRFGERVRASRFVGSLADFALAGVAFCGGLWLIRGMAPAEELSVLGAALLCWLVASFGSRLRGATAQDGYAVAKSALLVSTLIPIAGIGASAAAFTFSAGTASTPWSTNSVINTALVLFGCTGVLGAIAPSFTVKAARIGCAAAQLLIPLLLCVYYRSVYREPNGELLILGPNTLGSTFLLLVIGIMVVAAGAALRRTIKERHGREFKFDREIRIGTVVAVALFVFFTPPPYSVTVADDFHLGETLIPWQQLTVFGQRLYTDFVSVQGVLGLSYGAINEALFAGTVATYPIAAFWMLAIVNGVTAIAICRAIGSGWGLILAPITFTMLDRVLLVPLLFLLLASRWTTNSATRWIAVFVTVAALHFLWIPSTGTAFAISGAVFLIVAIVLAIQAGMMRRITKGETALALGALALVLGLAPFLAGALSFVSENGSTNAVAYGVMIEANHIPPNFPRWFGDPFFDMLVWEGIRFGGWLVGAFALLTIAALAGRAAIARRFPESNRIAAILILGIGGAAFAYALIPYSAGRIDGGGLSRSGCVTLLIFGFFIPVVVALYQRSTGVFPLALTALGLLLGVRFAYAPPTLGYLVERANQIVQIPGDAIKISATANGVPNLGDGYITARTWDEISRLRQDLALYLKEGETYFDLTNRSAFYFFLGKRVPSPYSADYLAANGAIQNRIVERLERERPPIAWVGPVMRFDESPTAIRSYRVLRWFLESGYRYESAFGNQFLVRPDRLVGDSSAEPLNELEPGLSRSDLGALPNAWGRNFSRLQRRFSERATLELSAPESGLLRRENNWLELRASRPQFRWKIPESAGMAEARPDYLLVEISRRGPPRRLRAELLWAARTAEGSRPGRSTKNDQPSWTADGSRPGRSTKNDQPSWTADGSRPGRSTKNDQPTPVGAPPSEFKRGTGITFQVKPGVLLIPLGSQLRWHREAGISELRLELTGESVGSKLRVERATLLRLVR